MTTKPSINPKNWRFTWESQSHIPILRLYLFNTNIKPSIQCLGIRVNLFFEQSFLTVSWFHDESNVESSSLKVPLPKALIDVDAPVNFKAFDDYIEVKFTLLIPFDHPIFYSMMSSFDGDVDELKPISVDSDLQKLSACEGVQFYCRNCSMKLTKSLRNFEEMPSVDWREAADNWFGTCCCSFGGVSEKLVKSYAKSYACTTGLCLLNMTSVVLFKGDLVDSKFDVQDWNSEYESLSASDYKYLSKPILDSGDKGFEAVFLKNKMLHGSDGEVNLFCPREGSLAAKIDLEVSKDVIDGGILSSAFQMLQVKEAVSTALDDTKNHTQDDNTGCCSRHASDPFSEQEIPRGNELAKQKSFLNGYLGNSFMAKSSYLSKDVLWLEFLCPHCSFPVGAYPHDTGDEAAYDIRAVTSLASRVHLFKCCISTSLDGVQSTNLFRKYTLERMFTSQLLDSANDELSFRTVVRDLQTKSPMLQIILLNPNLWSSTGYCLDPLEFVPKRDMNPTIKLLFSDCSSSNEFQLRVLEEWITKNQVEETYMLSSQIKDLIESLKAGNSIFPPSHGSLQGLSLSSLRR